MNILQNILDIISGKKGFYIPAGMILNGPFTSDAPGQVAGIINGDVSVNGKLIILKNGIINGNVKSQALEIWGSVKGDIECSSKMILQNSAFVKGNITTLEIHLEKDAVVDGIIAKPDTNNSIPSLNLEAEGSTEEKMGKAFIPTNTTAAVKPPDEELSSWF